MAFAYTAMVAKAQATVDAAAHALYNAGREPTVTVDSGEVDENGDPIMTQVAPDWDDLTNANKLAIIDALILERVQKLARGYLHDVRQAAAEESAALNEETIL